MTTQKNSEKLNWKDVNGIENYEFQVWVLLFTSPSRYFRAALLKLCSRELWCPTRYFQKCSQQCSLSREFEKPCIPPPHW